MQAHARMWTYTEMKCGWTEMDPDRCSGVIWNNLLFVKMAYGLTLEAAGIFCRLVQAQVTEYSPKTTGDSEQEMSCSQGNSVATIECCISDIECGRCLAALEVTSSHAMMLSHPFGIMDKPLG